MTPDAQPCLARLLPLLLAFGCATGPRPSGATAEGHAADVVQSGVLPGDPPVGTAPGIEPMQRFARNRLGPVQACYQAALTRMPKLAGKVTLGFSILPDGTLDRVVVVQDGLGGTGVAACVRSEVRTWRTPFRPAQEVTVEYPFQFAPRPPG